MSRRERLKWRAASLVDRLFHRRQCWADLVSWVLDTERVRDTGLRAKLPWRPIGVSCRSDAERVGRCYCGKVAADGSVLGAGETVCPAYMPGSGRRVCSRPEGHDGHAPLRRRRVGPGGVVSRPNDQGVTVFYAVLGVLLLLACGVGVIVLGAVL